MIEIHGQEIGQGHKVPIIAEIGINHNGSVELGKQLIDAAADAGASGVKFQTYTTELRFSPENPFYDTFQEMELSIAEEKELWDYAHVIDDFLVFSTPFDPDSASLCKELGADALKIASFETTNKELVRSVADQGLPVIASTGQNRANEVQELVEILNAGSPQYMLLHCISSYPMEEKDANLSVIYTLRERFECPVGFSDHSLGHDVAGYAVAAGACLIEKHFTIDKELEGPDHEMSVTPDGMAELVDEVRRVEQIMGEPELRVREPEEWIFENARRESE